MAANQMEHRRENEKEQTGPTSKPRWERNTMAKERARTHHAVDLPLPSQIKVEMIIQRTNKIETGCKFRL